MKAAIPGASFDYVFDEDAKLPDTEKSFFPIHQLTVEERSVVMNLKNAPGTASLFALHFGLGAPRNFFDDKGHPIVFQRDDKAAVLIGNKRPWKDESLNYLTPVQVDTLASLIIRGISEGITGAEAKNF